MSSRPLKPVDTTGFFFGDANQQRARGLRVGLRRRKSAKHIVSRQKEKAAC